MFYRWSSKSSSVTIITKRLFLIYYEVNGYFELLIVVLDVKIYYSELAVFLSCISIFSGSIDIERVIRERDFQTVDENVNNVIDYYLESEYDVKILDPNFVKLFRLAQLAVEYLLYCKQYLDQSVVILKEELKYKIEDNVKFKEEVVRLQDVVKEMKEKFKEKSKAAEFKSDAHGEIHKVNVWLKKKAMK